jgi:Glycosyl hydrolase family 76
MSLRRRPHRFWVLAVAVLVLAGLAVAGQAQPPQHRAAAAVLRPPKPDPRPPARSRRHSRRARVANAAWLGTAEAAYARSRAWWNPRIGWYRQFLPGYGNGNATMWGIVHLFEATSALAIADPTSANVMAARQFGDAAERYWDPHLGPPGYGPSPGGRGTHAWYDDEAWWAVALFDVYRATGDHRFLGAAARALAFVDSGWDPRGGGIYWDTHRTFKASESLAGATLTAAGLYAVTHNPHDLALAEKDIAWANAHIRGPDGLYGGRSTPAGPMPYVEGPMAEAMLRLCRATGRQRWCTEGERVMRAAAARFPTPDMGPQYDALYIRAVLEIYRIDHDPRWYRYALAAADRARSNAADPNGLELRTWDGLPISSIGTPAGKLQTHAATTSVFAWMAAAKPPPGG